VKGTVRTLPALLLQLCQQSSSTCCCPHGLTGVNLQPLFLPALKQEEGKIELLVNFTSAMPFQDNILMHIPET
jgi:hypothetical protein